MSGTRVVVETVCEHGMASGHVIGSYWPNEGGYCAEAERRTLHPGEFVLIEKVDGEWPEWVVGKMTGIYNQRRRLDALAGTDHTEGTP